MENVTLENKFYSRRLTNEMRETLLAKIKIHVDNEFVNNPLFNECIEQINIFTEALWEEVYKVMPKDHVNVVVKYPELCRNTTIRLTTTPEYYKESPDYFPYSTGYWSGDVQFGPNYVDKYTIPNNICTSSIFDQTLVSLGVEKCKKLYDTLYVNHCEKAKIVSAMKRVVYSATTTGKLVEAYPDMMKFIPEDWKKKEESTKHVKSSVVDVDVDLNAFLK